MEKNVKKDKTTNSKKKVEKKEPLKKEEKVINTKNSKNISLKETKKKDTDIKHLTYDNDTNRKICYAFLIGVIITIIVVIIIWPKRIATLKDGTQPILTVNNTTYTADDLYNDMKDTYSINILINSLDKMILDKKYKEDNEMNDSVKKTAEYYYSMYEQYQNITKEQFLENKGFKSEKEFLEYLKLDYRRNLYYDEYVKNLINEKDIEKYYKDEVFGDVNSKHILVSVSKDDTSENEKELSDEDAKKLANEIIDKLNKGTSWDDVINEYKDKITNEDLGYRAFNASLDTAYIKEMKNLKVNTYSKTPILSSYGYHIVYKIDQKDKPELKNVKEDIITILAEEKKNNDNNLYQKALINLRKEAKLEFKDTDLGEKYNKYISAYK